MFTVELVTLDNVISVDVLRDNVDADDAKVVTVGVVQERDILKNRLLGRDEELPGGLVAL